MLPPDTVSVIVVADAVQVSSSSIEATSANIRGCAKSLLLFQV